MSENKATSRTETYLNSLQVEQQVMIVILMHLLRHMIGSSPTPDTAFHQLRDEVLATLAISPEAPADPQETARLQAMYRMSAEDLFARIGSSLPLGRTTSDPSASN